MVLTKGVVGGGQRRRGRRGRIVAEGEDGDLGGGDRLGGAEAGDVGGDAVCVGDDQVGDGQGGLPVAGEEGDVVGGEEVGVGDGDEVVAEAGVAEALGLLGAGEGLGVEVEPVGAGGEDCVAGSEGDVVGEGHVGGDVGDAAALGVAEAVAVGAEGEDRVLSALGQLGEARVLEPGAF